MSRAFSIDTFTSKLRQGGALGSLFKCSLTAAQGTPFSSSIQDFEFLCKGAEFPASAVDVASVTYMGRAIQIPGNRAAAQLTTSLYNDEFMDIRNHIESWMELLNSHRTNKRAQGKQGINSYTGELTLEQLTKTGAGIAKSYTFVNAWPSNSGVIAVAWDSNEIQTFDIVWEYSYWKSGDSGVGTD